MTLKCKNKNNFKNVNIRPHVVLLFHENTKVTKIRIHRVPGNSELSPKAVYKNTRSIRITWQLEERCWGVYIQLDCR